MKQLKERLSALWHVLFDKEYIVFTLTLGKKDVKSASAFLSDSSSNAFIQTTLEVLVKALRERNEKPNIKK